MGSLPCSTRRSGKKRHSFIHSRPENRRERKRWQQVYEVSITPDSSQEKERELQTAQVRETETEILTKILMNESQASLKRMAHRNEVWFTVRR